MMMAFCYFCEVPILGQCVVIVSYGCQIEVVKSEGEDGVMKMNWVMFFVMLRELLNTYQYVSSGILKLRSSQI